MEINILHYFPKNTKIKVDYDLLKYLSDGKIVSEWGKTLEVSLKNMSRYLNGSRPLPLYLFTKLVNYNNLDLILFQNKINIKIGRNGKYIQIGPYLKVNEDWVYVSELIKGDGHIPSNFWTIQFVNKNKFLISFVKNFFISLGLPVERTCVHLREDIYYLTVRSYPIALILNKIFLVPTGKKMEIDIPNFVFRDPIFSAAAVRGAFDAEGCVSFTGSRVIIIASISKNWILQIQSLLTNLKIKSSIYNYNEKGRNFPIYRLHINNRINLKKFYEVINPLHTDRKTKLKSILDSYSRNPDYFFKKKILTAIKEGYCRKREIAKHLSLGLNTIGNNLAYLKKDNLIEPKAKFFTNKGTFFNYVLTSEGLKYLEQESHTFFE